MEEKILVESKHYNMKKFVIVVCIICILGWLGYIIHSVASNYNEYSYDYYYNYNGEAYKDSDTYLPYCMHTRADTHNYHYTGTLCKTYMQFKRIHPTVFSYMKCCLSNKRHNIDKWLRYGDDLEFSLINLIPIPLAFIIFLWLSKFSMTITDKRVYGKAAFGKRVDLPVDLVSAVGTSWLKGIDVGTSSGKIHFKLVKNQDEIHTVLSNLLLERQQKTVSAKNVNSTSNADELKKYKDLLDIGAITQVEFEEKKKQLLNL